MMKTMVDFRLLESKVVTGSGFQSLASVTFISRSKYESLPVMARPNCSLVLIEDNCGNGNGGVFLHGITKDRLADSSTVFCYGDNIRLFIRVFERLFRNIITVIIHNSDEEFSKDYLVFLQHPQVARVFAQNATFTHPKLVCLPIGLANRWWPHGNIELFMEVLCDETLQAEPRNPLLINFSPSTHKSRTGLRFELDALGVTNSSNWAQLSQIDYLRAMCKSRLVFAPRGNGVDTHRFWEAIYMNIRPVILRRDFIPVYEPFEPFVVENVSQLKEIASGSVQLPEPSYYESSHVCRLIDLDFYRHQILKAQDLTGC